MKKCPDFNAAGFSVDSDKMICTPGTVVTSATTQVILICLLQLILPLAIRYGFLSWFVVCFDYKSSIIL